MDCHVIILAAGKGTRMKSAQPKVLHPLGGKTLLAHVIECARALKPKSINIVVGYQSDVIKSAFETDNDLNWVEQSEQLGTGHAVQQALPSLEGGATVIMYGDMPLIHSNTLKELIESGKDSLSVLTTIRDNANGFGRIIRDSANNIQAIREERDCTEEERRIKEVNTGFIAANTEKLKGWLNKLNNNNSQGEYYLTDAIEIAINDNEPVSSVLLRDSNQALGVNSKSDLAQTERALQKRLASKLMEQGVHLYDPERIDIRGTVHSGSDVVIDINNLFEGTVTLGVNARIGANCVLKNCQIGANTVIHPYTHIEDSAIGTHCEIGPYARIRPQSQLADQVKIGNFVETKKVSIEARSKVNHLSYIGDTHIGENTNVGAGTITCNYDGANKHQTTIGNNVFIGSNSALVAPITINDGATVGAGSTISEDVAPNILAVERAKTAFIAGWKRPQKKKK